MKILRRGLTRSTSACRRLSCGSRPPASTMSSRKSGIGSQARPARRRQFAPCASTRSGPAAAGIERRCARRRRCASASRQVSSSRPTLNALRKIQAAERRRDHRRDAQVHQRRWRPARATSRCRSSAPADDHVAGPHLERELRAQRLQAMLRDHLDAVLHPARPAPARRCRRRRGRRQTRCPIQPSARQRARCGDLDAAGPAAPSALSISARRLRVAVPQHLARVGDAAAQRRGGHGVGRGRGRPARWPGPCGP